MTVVEERFALDLTIDQATRPQHNINPKPGVFNAPAEFLAGSYSAGGYNRDAWLEYTAIPDERGFLTAADWRLVTANDRRNPTPRLVRALTNGR